MVVGRRGEREGEADAWQATEASLALACRGFRPAEHLLDPFPDPEADSVAGMPRRPPVKCRTPAALLLSNVRRGITLTQLGNEVPGVITWAPTLTYGGALIMV